MVDTEFWRPEHVTHDAATAPVDLRRRPGAAGLPDAGRGGARRSMPTWSSPPPARGRSEKTPPPASTSRRTSRSAPATSSICASCTPTPTLVVVPLQETDFQAGITTILEAMSMARALVCTRTSGQTDTIVEGETGRYVPPGDAGALRAAIEDLLADPDEAARLAAVGSALGLARTPTSSATRPNSLDWSPTSRPHDPGRSSDRARVPGQAWRGGFKAGKRRS